MDTNSFAAVFLLVSATPQEYDTADTALRALYPLGPSPIAIAIRILAMRGLSVWPSAPL